MFGFLKDGVSETLETNFGCFLKKNMCYVTREHVSIRVHVKLKFHQNPLSGFFL